MDFQDRANQIRRRLEGHARLADATVTAQEAYKKGNTVNFVKASAGALEATQASTEATQRVLEKIGKLRRVRTPLLEQFNSPENLNLENLFLCRAFFRQVLLRLTERKDLNRADLCDLGIAGKNPNAETLYSSDTLRVEVSDGSDRTFTLRYPEKDFFCHWPYSTARFKSGLLTTVNIQPSGQTSGVLCDELNTISGMLNQTGDRQAMKITLPERQANKPLPSGEQLIFPAVETFPMPRRGKMTRTSYDHAREMRIYREKVLEDGPYHPDSFGYAPMEPDSPKRRAGHNMLLARNRLSYGAALPTLAALGAVSIRGSSTVNELVGGDLASKPIRVKEGLITMADGALSVVMERNCREHYEDDSVGEEISLVSVSPRP